MTPNVFKRLFVDSKPVVHVLVCLFAISSWVDINGMWVELPLFVTNLPEKWTLPSYITILSQIANIGPIIFLVVAYCLAKLSVSKLALDKVTSYLIMLVGVTSTLLLAFLWQRTAEVAGSERSIALLALSFFLSLMDCTSSVAYVAFMAALKPAYMASFFVGEGLSGLLPAVMALGQGAGDIVCVNGSSVEERNVSGVLENVTTYSVYPMYLPPRFSVQLFFLLLSGMIAISIASFSLINFCRYCKDEFVDLSSYNLEEEIPGKKSAQDMSRTPVESFGIYNASFTMDDSSPADNCGQSAKDLHEDFEAAPSKSFSGSSCSGSRSYGTHDSVSHVPSSRKSAEVEEDGEHKPDEKTEVVSLVTIIYLLTQVVFLNFLITTFLPTIQVYSSLPYDISTYNLVVTLTNIANPVACLISMFLAVSSPVVITLLTSLGMACGAYIIAAASMSPEPPLVGYRSGGAIAVLTWVGASFFLTYAKVSVAGVMRQVGRRALLWYGVATQFGALLGAITGFVLVNEIKVFTDAPWC